MKAITVEPHSQKLRVWKTYPEPDARAGSVLVEAIAVSVCGTDVEESWRASPVGRQKGEMRLVLGHESLGRVLDPGTSGAFQKGDLVAASSGVRTPCPAPTAQ